MSKFSSIFALLVFVSSQVSAQSSDSTKTIYDDFIKDTTMIPQKRMPQHRDFLNETYNYPSKPRNQWELGINVGQVNISGDVRTKSLHNAARGAMPLGFGATIRKSFGYIMSTRLQFVRGVASGYNYEKAKRHWGHDDNHWSSVNNQYYRRKVVYDNYKSTISELSLQVVFSANNIRFHKHKSRTSVYALVGLGGMTYYTRVNALNGTTPYDFEKVDDNISTSTNRTTWEQKKEVNKRLRNLFDNSYETDAEINPGRGTLLGKRSTFRGIGTFGVGAQYRINRRLTLQLENKATWTSDDLLDGVRWQGPTMDIVTGNQVAGQMTRDMDSWNYFSLGLNVNIGGNSTSPLWWLNPMDYTYQEVRSKNSGGKCDIDSDLDGVSDCFDMCPNTPKGVNSDAHGCPIDTDGDGVPDYKDKQLITPTECQPSNPDGVGNCPDPECCKRTTGAPPRECNSFPMGTVRFASNSTKLNSMALAPLNNLASLMRSAPMCKIVIIGNGGSSKIEQQRSWDRVNSVINYLVDKQGIDRERFIFQYGGLGDTESVEYRSAADGEEGPSNTPPPFPNLRNGE